MATMKELSDSQMDEAVAAAAERRVPLTLTVRLEDGWQILHSRLVALRGEHLLVTMPKCEGDSPATELKPDETVGVSFKFKHHKHIFCTTVLGTESLQDEEGQETRALSLRRPEQMRKLQRRAFTRAPVPRDKIVRASFWSGGLEAEPSQSSPETPVLTGKVVNISAGGVQVACLPEIQGALEPGETVGMHITFGVGEEEAISLDAQFRHIGTGGDQVLLGFRFVGLEQTGKGRQTLQQITYRTAQLARLGGGWPKD